MRNGIIVCRLSLIKTNLLAFHVLRKFPDSAGVIKCPLIPVGLGVGECVCVCGGGGGGAECTAGNDL